MPDIARFYDSFVDRLVNDYERKNRRVVAALEFAKPNVEGSVLDVGCGIGWTTNELGATGIDISPALIAKARSMFPQRFICTDFCEWEPEPFDSITMFDVYEHFPRDSRDRVHEQIRATGARNIVITVPTPEAVQHARDMGRAQPIDEDVTLENITLIASSIGGKIEVNRILRIGRAEYRHVLIRL